MIELGIISKAQGIKGEIKVSLSINDDSFVQKIKYITIDGIRYAVANLRLDRGNAYILLTSVTDRNMAELMRGKKIFVEKATSQLSEGTMFVDDVIGCNVKTSSGIVVGVVKEILTNTKGADVYYLQSSDGTVVFPFIKKLIVSCNLEARLIVVDEKVLSEVSFIEN